jgi:hypothetical protein
MARRGLFLFIFVFCLTGVLGPAAVSAQEEAASQMPPMGPPEEIKVLEPMVGVWNVEFSWREDPTQEEWMTSPALATIKMVLDGSAQQMEMSGEMGGMKYTGIGTMCYNRNTKKWQNTWIDNMGAYLSYAEGVMEDGKLTFIGKDLMQGTEIHTRHTTYNITSDRFDWMMETSTDGENFVVMGKGVYTRR